MNEYMNEKLTHLATFLYFWSSVSLVVRSSARVSSLARQLATTPDVDEIAKFILYYVTIYNIAT